MHISLLAVSCVTWFASSIAALYIPGIAPTEFRIGQRVPIYVNALSPGTTDNDARIHEVISYDYYYPPFHFCIPEGGPVAQSESIGSVLMGDRILSSAYELEFLKNETCRTICTTTVDHIDAKIINDRIRDNYLVEMLIDNLPAGSRMADLITQTEFDMPGFLLGDIGATTEQFSQPVYHNLYEITIDYHKIDDEDYRIVGVEVVPASTSAKDCAAGKPIKLDERDGKKTTFDFKLSVRWRKSDLTWATRWDRYLHVYDPKIHWLSLTESFVIVIFLTVTVAAVLVRTLRRDVKHYNALELERDGVVEDAGWKLVHADVFRQPDSSLMLAILLGNGVQLLVMVGTTIVLAALGFLSPSNRGSLATAALVLYALYGTIGGFTAALVYKTLGKAERYKTLLVLTPMFAPSVIFGTSLLLNFVLISKGASGAVPLGTMAAIVAIWFLVSLPLSVAGGLIGFKVNMPADPVKTNQIPRQIPPQPVYLRAIPTILLAGIMPFGAIFVELFFMLNSLWFGRIYWMFGFLFLTYGILLVSTALTTILTTYLQLCAENHRWWWRSIWSGGSIAIYVLVNSIVYYVLKLRLAGLSSVILYFGYTALIAFSLFLVTGTVGFFASFIFVRTIYASIKVD
ncbi:Transmembrane 9 super member 2 [Savitreella phatthalungensis]